MTDKKERKKMKNLQQLQVVEVRRNSNEKWQAFSDSCDTRAVARLLAQMLREEENFLTRVVLYTPSYLMFGPNPTYAF